MPMINCPTCSASLKVPDGMAGRKARCNKCQNIFVIPASSVAVAAVPPQPAPMPQRQAVPQHAVPPAPPPMPAHAYQQGPPQYNPTASPGIAPSPRGQRPVDPFADGAPPPPRRRKKKGGFPVLLVAMIGGGVVLLGLIILLVFLFWPGGGSSADMVYMPDNAEMIGSVQVRSLLSSGAWQTLAKDFPDMESKLKDMKAEIGIDKDDINSVMFGGKSKGGNEGVAAIRTSNGYTADKILENMNQKGNASTSTAGSHTIHKINNFGDKSFCVVNSNLILLGSENTLQAVLKRNGQPNLSSSMKSALSSASFGSTIAFAMDASIGGKNPMGGPMGGFSPPEYGYGDINFGSTIAVRGSVIFKDGKNADDAKKLIEGGLAAVKLQPLPAKVKELLESVNISASGTQLSASVSVNPANIKDMMSGLPMGGGFNPLGMLGNLGGGGPKPPPFNPGGGPKPPFNPGGTTVGVPHTDFPNLLKNSTKTYRVICNAGQMVTMNIKPQFDIKANITVTQNGKNLAQDFNGNNIRQNISVSWTPPASGICDVTINHVDNLDNQCTVSFTPGGGAPPINNPNPPPPPAGGKVIMSKNGTIFQNGGQEQHFVNLQAGATYIIKMNSAQVDSYLELYGPNGQKVGQDDDGGGFPNARLVHTASQTGNYRIVCRTFGNQGKGGYSLTVEQQ